MIWAVAALIVVVGLVAVLNAIFPGVLSDTDSQMQLTHKILLLALIGGSVILGYRGRATAAFKHGLIWAGIALILVLAYSFRDDAGSIINRVTGELLPATPMMTSRGEVDLGGIMARNVAATVHRGGLDQSLLGMNFLDRLAGFERRGDLLVLKP